MLIQLGVNESLAKCHSLARRVPGSIIVWNGRSYELASEKKSFIQPKLLVAAVIAAGGCFYGLNARVAWSSGDVGMSSLCGLFAFVSAGLATTTLFFQENASDCASFLNGLLRIESDWKKDKAFQQVVRANGLVKLLTRTIIASQLLYPWIFSLVALVFPCSALNMFSSAVCWCDEDDDTDEAASWLVRTLTGLGTAAPHVVFWKAFASGAAMDAMHVFLGSLSQKSLLQYMKSSLISAGHNPFELNLYRSCQLINICFSNYCSSITILALVMLMGGQISFSFVLLKILHDPSINIPLLIKIMMIAACPSLYLVQVVTTDEAARVYTASISLWAKWQGDVGGHGQSELRRRQVRSASPLRVKLGECNYIEAATTLVMLDFILRRLVDLLIIGKR